MTATQEPAIHDAAPPDTDEITDLGAAAAWDTPVARWLTADADARRREPRPDRAGIPACPKAGDHRNRELNLRYGYVSQAEFRPDGSPRWTMWRSPMP
jgi:hypothetical protein